MSSRSSRRSPPQEFNWVDVAGGHFFTRGITDDARMYCWGIDGEGRIADGPGETVPGPATPFEVSGGTPDWAQVDAGYGHACAVKTTGRYSPVPVLVG